MDREDAGVEWYRQTLKDHVSADPAREVLHAVHADDGWLVATTGQVLFAVKAPLACVGVVQDGHSYQPAGILKGQLWCLEHPSFPYPTWRQVAPTEPPVAVFRAQLPRWVSARKKGFSGPRGVTITKEGSLIIGEEAGLVTFDLRFLRPYARLYSAVYFGIHGDLAPVVIGPTAEGVRAPLKAQWFGLVMPMRPTSPPVLTRVK